MFSRLNGWQRLWVLFAAVFLASTIAVIAAAWPKHDPALVADLRSPECQAWRDKPADAIPDVYPETGAECYSIRSFLADKHVIVRSEDDYDRYLAGAGAKTALLILTGWAVFAAGTYLLGWAGVQASRILLKRRRAIPQQRPPQR
jgi:hypothetical protein